jgi:hypothetical protein
MIATPAELDLAGQHDEQALAGLALVEQGRSPRRLDDLEFVRQRLDRLRIDALKQAGPAQDLVHVRSSTRRRDNATGITPSARV